MIRARLGRLFVATLIATSSLALLGVSAPQAATVLPVLHLGVDGPFIGCNPSAQRTSAATQLLLSLAMPESTIVQTGAVIAPAVSVIAQAEVTSLHPMKVVYGLIPNAPWSDGSAVSIKDFIATWHAGARGSAPTSDQYSLIKSITPLLGSPNAVQVLFSKPASGWRDLFNPLMPASTITAAANCRHPDPDINLSAGPYLIASAGASGATLVANPSWTGAAQRFSAIVLSEGVRPLIHILAEPGSAAVLATNIPGEALGNGVSSLPTVRSSATFSNDLVSLDFSTVTWPTKSRPIRVALAALIRRNGLVASVGGPYIPSLRPAMSHFWTQGMINYSGTNSPLPQPSDVNTFSAKNQSYNPILAGHNLRILGYSKVRHRWMSRRGKPLKVKMAIQSNDAWTESVARHLVKQWSEHGIEVSIIHVADVSLAERGLRRGTFTMAIVVRPTSPYVNETVRWYLPSPTGPASVLWNGYHDSTVTRTLRQAEADMNPQDAASLYQSIDTRLWITMSSLPIMVEPSFLVSSATLTGVVADPYAPGFVSMMGQWSIGSAPSGN